MQKLCSKNSLLVKPLDSICQPLNNEAKMCSTAKRRRICPEFLWTEIAAVHSLPWFNAAEPRGQRISKQTEVVSENTLS